MSREIKVTLEGDIPDSAIGACWAVQRLPVPDPADFGGKLPIGFPHECALLETDGAVYLGPNAARQVAGLLLAYAEDYEKEL